MDDDKAFPIAQLSGGACMIAASGELDASSAWRLQDALGAASATGASRVIADFAAVTYLDADALAILASCAVQIHRAGGTLVVVTDDPWLLRLLDAEHSRDVLEVEPTLREVIERLPVGPGVKGP